MNQNQKKLMFNQSFETGGRTVFKVGGGFQILPQGKAGMIQNNFKVLVILKYFKVLAGLRSQFEYSTSDFTGITKPSCIKKAWNLGKVFRLVFQLLHKPLYFNRY